MKLMIRLLLAVGALLSGTASFASTVDLSGTARTDTLIWHCEISGNSFTINYRLRRTILNSAGHEFANVYLSESPFDKLASFEARVFDAQGKELSHVRKKDLQKACGYGASFELYSDNCSYAYEPQVSACPYTIDYSYSKECSSLFFLHGVSLQREIPLSYASISVTHEAKSPIRYKAYQLDIPVVTSSGGDRLFASWTIDNLAAEPGYTYVPSEYREGSRIELAASQFSIAQYKCPEVTWKKLGLFYNQMNESRYLPLPPDVQRPPTPEAADRIADSLYELTVRQTHYVAVTVKLSGWQTDPASQTHRCRRQQIPNRHHRQSGMDGRESESNSLS
jgi:hypothetical protein